MTRDSLHYFGSTLAWFAQPVTKRVKEVVESKPLPIMNLSFEGLQPTYFSAGG